MLQAADTTTEHLVQLASTLDPSEGQRKAREGFLRAFIRPAGLDVPATPLFADAVEKLATLRSAPADRPRWCAAVLAPLSRRLFADVPGPVTRWLLQDEVEIRRARSERRRRRTKEHAKRVRARNPRKQIAAIKTRIKRSLGLPTPSK
jgi:hypothetical protein